MREEVTYNVTDFGIGKLHPAQARFVKSQKPQILYCGGRGSGKTVAGMLKIILACMDPRNRGTCLAMLSPTYRQLVRVQEPLLMSMLRSFKERSGFSILKRHYKADHRWEFLGGAVLFSQSYDRVDRIRSLSLSCAYIDEIESDPDPFGTYGTISAAIRGPGAGQVFTTTTPRGNRGLVAQFLQAQKQGGIIAENMQLIISKTADNPYVSKEYLARLRSSMSRTTYLQEVLSHIVKSSVAVWPEWTRDLLVPYVHDGGPYSIGVDWGYGSPAVVAIAHVRGDGDTPDRDVVFWEFVNNEIPEAALIQEIVDFARSMGRDPEMIAADRAVPHQNQHLMRAFRSTRVKTMRSKMEQEVWAGVEQVRALIDPIEGPPRLYFADSLVKTKSKRGIVESMENLRRVQRDGEVQDQVRKGDGGFDDVTDALRYIICARYARRGFASAYDSGGAGDIVDRKIGRFGKL